MKTIKEPPLIQFYCVWCNFSAEKPKWHICNGKRSIGLWEKMIEIEEHLDHWENPAMCIDPDNCPVVYASIMHESEKGIQPQTPFFQPSRLEYLKKHWNTTNHDPFLCLDCTEYLEDFPDGFNSDLEAQRQ